MSVVYKVTITRPNFDSLCFFEDNPQFDITQNFPTILPSNVIDYSYEPNITWDEVNTRKHELRPDLLVYLDSIGIESIISDPISYAAYPCWNPFSLDWTHLYTFDTVENALSDISLGKIYLYKNLDEVKDMITQVGSTVTYEELLVDDVPYTTFVKKLL
jgi:hypothetical protein